MLGLVAAPTRSEISLQAPKKVGAYRLFAYVFDGQGHAAHANIPFYVDDSAKTQQAAATVGQP
jgi:hypothetical protein